MPKDRKKKRNSLQLKRRLFIICEGRKTEYHYFDNLVRDKKSRGCSVCIKVLQGKNPTPDRLINQALRCREIEEDEVWVVFDRNGFSKHEEIFEKARKKDIMIAFSSISFEYWVLIHYKYTSRAYNNSEALIKELKNHLNFKKNDTELYMELTSKTVRATSNAQKIRKHQGKDNPGKEIFELNPYTNVDELLDSIDRIIAEYQ